MNIQHLNLKFFVENPAAVDLADFISIFNGWIQARFGEETLVDVADYRQVFAGPGVILIGHEANYSLDNTGNRLGLLYNRKAQLAGALQDRLTQAARAALHACRRLEAERGLKFDGREAQLLVNDRLSAPNTAETFSVLAPELESFFGRLYGGAAYTLERNPDPRERFTVTAQAATHFEVEALLKNLN
ncbi:MAG TPA: hypothetical protein VJG32_01800 [Anaerolineae bacterium]|nr:hypothetical protein [Anaerolineae bacterium]